MVEGSASASITSALTSRPQHEHDPTVPTENKNNKTTAYSATGNHQIDNFSRERLHLKSTQELQTPSHHRSRNGENQIESRHHQQRQRYHSVPYGSPFISPPATTIRRPCRSEIAAPRHSQRSQASTRSAGLQFLSPTPPSTGFCISKATKTRPEPLVLDPGARSLPGRLGACNSEHRRVTLSSTSSTSQIDSRGRNSTVQKLFQVAAKGIREHHATAAQYSIPDSSFNAIVNSSGYLHTTPAAVDVGYGTNATSAAVFARSNGVVHAGFLQKLGENIPEFKRRFFVLKPETSLYYYLSPSETEPRGKIDLEGSTIGQTEKLPDGRLRFTVSLNNEDCGIKNTKCGDNGNSTGNQDESHDVVLEARSVDIGEEWIRHMKGERVSFLKERNESLTNTVTKQANQIADLEQQIQHFRMIEADRDGALEDAKNWKNKFIRLDEALRLLTQQIRKYLSIPFTTERESDCKGDQVFDGNNENASFADNDKRNTDCTQSASNEDSCHEVPDTSNGKTPMKNNCEIALLDDLVHEEMDVEEIMDVPGTYFSGLSNACKQQKESSRLASIEASAAVEDILQANDRVEVIQKRMHKAEKQILKLWEENCDVRKTLKQKKREKRVLVKEVKQLQQTVQDLKTSIKKTSTVILGLNEKLNEERPMADTMIGSDEERLIIELEEHVASSIRLHERLLGGNEFDRDMEQSISTDPASVNFDAMDTVLNGGSSRFEHIELEASKAKLLSLFDDETDSEEGSVQQQDSEDHKSRIETQSLLGSIASSVDPIATEHIQYVVNAEQPSSLSLVDTDISSPHRANPLLELDNKHDAKPKLISLKPSSPKLITENGHATSRLVCPLADVVDVRGRSTYDNVVGSAEYKGSEVLRVHHLTFYSQKIGLQFQKASPAPSKPRGLLTDAVTADLVEEVDGSDKTAAELRNVASIASLARGGIIKQRKQSKSTLLVPDDIVLVCGFEGFDDSGVNQRPNLGARLIAFDGISVEVGKWTFESIRKAIKSRRRPLTLSFRNDFLTTEQRATLTKAVKDVDAKRDPVNPVLKYERPKSSISSYTSASSFEFGHFLNNNDNNHLQGDYRPDGHVACKSLDISTAATEESNCWNQCPASSSSSISSDFKDIHVGRLAPASTSSRLSEAGSSGTASSLMNSVRKASTSPEQHQGYKTFLGNTENKGEGLKHNRRFGTGKNPSGTQQHQDFQAHLL